VTGEEEHLRRIRDSLALAQATLDCSHERLGELLGVDPRTITRNLERYTATRYLARRWLANTRQAAALRALVAGARMGLTEAQAAAQLALRLAG